MSHVIWKFELDSSNIFYIPKGGKVIAAKAQKEKVCIWVLVDTSNPAIERFFKVYGTGYRIPDAENLKFIDTVLMDNGDLVLHIFERLQTSQQGQPT
jgi:hypothetical protein